MTEIATLLDRLEKEHEIRICYACESGSRAWGFASPDSDYDIRFLFVRPASSYLAIDKGLESLDLPMEGELDAGGWDLRKSVKLLSTSNGALLEWLHSPVVYREDEDFLARWREAAREWFAPAAAYAHYRGLATGMIRSKLIEENVRAKDYLYALRSSLAARWIAAGKGIPPVAFAELVPMAPAEVQAVIPELLEWKSRTVEGEKMPRHVVLDAFFQDFLTEQVELPRKVVEPETVNRFFRAEIPVANPILRATDFTLERIRRRDLLLLDSVAGSHAYGTAIEGSDEDRRGIFIAPASFLLGLETIQMVSDERSDEVYYEVGRLLELLLKNNPNALDLLAMPEDCLRYRHPVMDLLKPEIFLSKLCAKTFGEYSMGQIRKARGLNKKIVNPQPEQRLAMLDFCHVPEGQGSVPVLDWLTARGIDPKDCGLTAVQHASGMYGIYRGSSEYRGLVSPRDPDTLIFSSVPKEAAPLAWMHYNQDAFRAHCKAHREYWEWVANRNEERYSNNVSHGRGYDSKNLMHTHRLLDMAAEIAAGNGLLVRRPNREELLRIRAGDFTYEDLVSRAEEKLAAVEEAFLHGDLPDAPDPDQVNELLLRIRASFG
ncbi:MAG: nucleotidyltransferase [Akkermansiaceae bacterium]|nr:nucleotidyltransferase [Akkermansiaceae bacterium]